VDVSRGTERAGVRAAPRRLDGIERKIQGSIKEIQPGRFQPGQVDRSIALVDSPHSSSLGIGDNLRPNLVSLTHHDGIGVKETLLRHDRGVHPAQDHRHMPLPVMIGDLIGTVDPEDLEGDPHEIGSVVEMDLLDPLILDGDVMPFRSGRCQRRQG